MQRLLALSYDSREEEQRGGGGAGHGEELVSARHEQVHTDPPLRVDSSSNPATHSPIHEQLFGGAGRGGLGRGERPRVCINGYLSGLGQGYRR